MLISTLIRLILIAIITGFLIAKPEARQIKYFSQQTWTTKETFPVYWALVLLSLVSLILYKILYKNAADTFAFQVISYIMTLFAGFILCFGIRIVIFKRKLSLYVIGLGNVHIFIFVIFILIQYAVLIGLFAGRSIQDYNLFIWSLTYYSVVLVLWPVIEEVLYLGMIFIPTSRKVGLLSGAVLVSLLQTLPHFNHDLAALIKNFALFGLLGCYLYIRTRGILVPLLLHSSANFFALLRDLNFI